MYDKDYYLANKDKWRKYRDAAKYRVDVEPLSADEYHEGQNATLRTPKVPPPPVEWFDPALGDIEPGPDYEVHYDFRPRNLRTVATTQEHTKDTARVALAKLAGLKGLVPLDGEVYQTARAWYLQAVPA